MKGIVLLPAKICQGKAAEAYCQDHPSFTGQTPCTGRKVGVIKTWQAQITLGLTVFMFKTQHQDEFVQSISDYLRVNPKRVSISEVMYGSAIVKINILENNAEDRPAFKSLQSLKEAVDAKEIPSSMSKFNIISMSSPIDFSATSQDLLPVPIVQIPLPALWPFVAIFYTLIMVGCSWTAEMQGAPKAGLEHGTGVVYEPNPVGRGAYAGLPTSSDTTYPNI